MMNLPEDFIRETRLLMGEERFNRYLGAFEEEAPVSIRLNSTLYTLNSKLLRIWQTNIEAASCT